MHEATGAQEWEALEESKTQTAPPIETDMRQTAAQHEQASTLSMVNVRNSELNKLQLNKGNENEVEEVELEEEEEVQKKTEPSHPASWGTRVKTPITVCWLEGLFVCHWAYTKKTASWIHRGGRMGSGSGNTSKCWCGWRSQRSLGDFELGSLWGREFFKNESFFIIIPGKMLQWQSVI